VIPELGHQYRELLHSLRLSFSKVEHGGMLRFRWYLEDDGLCGVEPEFVRTLSRLLGGTCVLCEPADEHSAHLLGSRTAVLVIRLAVQATEGGTHIFAQMLSKHLQARGAGRSATGEGHCAAQV
jgi:hypothetical protein